MTSDAYPLLFSPLRLAGFALRNRVVHASITTRSAENGNVAERLMNYLVNRARGGCAMIVTEPLSMAQRQNHNNRICVFNGSAVDGLTHLANAVHAEGCLILGQIAEAGRGRHEAGRNYTAIGPSSLPDDISWTMPHQLTATEIADLIGEFSQSAARLKRCGFNGVELSCGHGHLFHQFMSPWSNRRKDEYGGCFDNRMRFMSEFIATLRRGCGRDFIVGLKLPGADGVPGGIGPELAAQIADRLTSAGDVDYVTFAQGAHHRSLEMHVPDDYAPRLTYMDLFRKLRPFVNGVPLMALGRITDPAEAEGILSRGESELVALGRSLIVDPAWPAKAAKGAASSIRYCVSKNMCWAVGVQHRPVACDNNPRLGLADEVDWKPVVGRRRKRIAVIGAGVAGMEAAWVAQARGHEPIVFGRSADVGGKTRLHAALPGSESLSSVYDFQIAAANKAGVRLELGVDATTDDIASLAPDEVVMATGSVMTWPLSLPEALQADGIVPDVRAAAAQRLQRPLHQPGTAVLFDMDHTEGTYAAAELFKGLFDRLVLITPRDSFAQDTAMVTRQGIIRRLYGSQIELLVNSEPVWSSSFEEHGQLEYRNVFTGAVGAIDDIALFTYATPRTVDIGLLQPLQALGLPVHRVGDCRVARNVMAATSEGYELGNSL